ncbi:bifunctional aldolase/short-chain dehydrogenase [Synechocystis sp. LKSZ1]|uniref:bifunctional aldolase/short-chain dehydrogenase n=1 Tax=Synechocystis sp. LKSZ1 TaxID=3144951 RepID=UPI00336BAF68
MQSLWNDQEAARYDSDLGQRVYTSRLLGRDPSLVLHGGGNTSVKIQETNLVGETEEILYVKGSGWDLATIEAAGFAPVRMSHLLKLARLPALSDPAMVNELKTQVTQAKAPTPSVETILHALLPYKYVDHTHADAVVAITNTAQGRERIVDIYGAQVVVIPYVMPGFDLARICAECFPREAGPQTIGMVLMNHGIFSFGQTAREAYERMIYLVDLAEAYLQQKQVWDLAPPLPRNPQPSQALALAKFRAELSATAGFSVILQRHQDDRSWAFSQRGDLATVSQQGPATPDHVIRTKRLPLLGRDIEAYAAAYQAYFQAQSSQSPVQKTVLDPAPRVILDPEWGLCTVGRTAKDAVIAGDIYQHTMAIIEWATGLGGYQALSAAELFAVEYWDLEQAKLQQAGQPPMFRGEVVLITGAASGIGKACVESFLQRGAAVIALDIQAGIERLHQRPDYYGLQCDLTDETAFQLALEKAINRFGGLDMLVLNAGIFPPARAIADLSGTEWRRVLSINLDANLMLLRECYPFLALAHNGGRVVVIGSKNVPAPGPGVAAYSASKAALNQLIRVAALEWSQQGIRLNSIHPNAVFDTGIWTEEVIQARAKHYGLSVEQYKTNNLLRVEINSRDVAEMVAEMAGPRFAKTTAAQIPLDGGNERVI